MAWFPAVLAIVMALAAPPQTRPRAAAATGSSAILGTVTDQRTGQPISGAVVTLTGSDREPNPESITDGDGQFVFDRLPAGRYGLIARRGGYFDGKFGQRRPLGSGATITIDDGERFSAAAIALVKPAAVVGTVLDDAGEPVVKLEVRAYQRVFLGGRPHFAPAGGGRTDDRGVFRIGLLAAGDFIVGVPLTRPGGADGAPEDARMPRDRTAVASLPPTGAGRAQVFPPAYFPAGVAAPNASVISLDFGDVRRNVDIQVRPAPAFRLSGAIATQPGDKPGARIRLSTVDEAEFDGGEIATLPATDAGTFAIGGIPPGQYVLSAESSDAWATELISVADADLGDLRLLMRDRLRVSGRLVFDGARPSPDRSAAQALALSIERADGRPLAAPARFELDRAARGFTISGLSPGRYVLSVDKDLPDWRLKSAMYQGRDVSQSAFELASGDITELLVTMTDRTGRVAGTVTALTGDTENVTVFVFPQDPQRWVDFGASARAFRTADAGSGTFEVRDLPAGDYYAVAVVADPGEPWKQPEFLQAAARAATAVQISDGIVRQLDLKVSVIR